jgi:hypothetical protein
VRLLDHLGDAQMEGSPPPRGSDLGPLCILIIGTEQGAKLGPNSFDKFSTGDVLRDHFLIQNRARKVYPVPAVEKPDESESVSGDRGR